MPAKRDDIIKYCEEYLKVNEFKDYCHNGLQVEGATEIKKIVTGVSFSQKLVEAAIEKKAQMLIVHHGIFMDMIASPPVVKGYVRDRLKMLLEHDMNLAGFHLPLDAHPEIGNNISLCKLLGVKKTRAFDIGFIGSLSRPMPLKQFVRLVNDKLSTHAYVIPAGPATIKTVAIVSGGSSPDAMEAAKSGADAFIAGDIRESVVRAVEETKINLIHAGHYNTEKFGIQNLGRFVSKKFKVDVEFVDVPCEI